MDEINNIFFLGNLTRDPELGQTEKGSPYAEISLAVNQYYKTRDGEQMQAVDYIQLTCFNTLARNCASSLRKGSRVLVAGHVKFRPKLEEDKKGPRMFLTAGVVAASLEFCELSIAEH